MSLRRSIAIAAAVAVAAVAAAISVVGYQSTGSHLLGEVRYELRVRAQAFLGPSAPGPADGDQSRDGGRRFRAPAPRELGGAAGYFQVVEPNGAVPFGGKLPVTKEVLAIARNGSGSFFSQARVGNTNYEVYTVWDAVDRHVVQVALPLTDDEAVLHSLLLPYGLLIGGGVLLAALLGLAISRIALRPIERFLNRTEAVTSELARPTRIEEIGPSEIRRLAATFNQTLDALERSIEAQRQLVADASHELRTPIAALRSNIQIFLEAERLPRHERESLQESILAELDELTQIVADVVELARGSAPNLRREPVELDSLVRESVERAQRRAPSVHFNLDLEPTVVDGVGERIARAITNAIDNARKWSPPGGEVEVTLRDGTLVVRDHGPGFNQRDLPHVFDRFYRAESARRLPGSGLGLAIVRQTAEGHGGSAEATNASDGGAILRMSFGRPSSPPSSPPAPITHAEIAPAGSS